MMLFFCTRTPTTEIYTLSLHDALPISWASSCGGRANSSSRSSCRPANGLRGATRYSSRRAARSEEHTSELQSLAYLVCRLLLEKKKHARRNLNQLSRHCSCTEHGT